MSDKKPNKIISNIYDVFEPFYGLLRIFGFVVFTVSSAEENRCEVRRANWLYLTVSSSVLLGVFILNLNINFFTFRMQSDIVMTMTRYILLMGILVVMETTIANRFLQPYLWKLLRNLYYFDKMMMTVNAPVDHPLHRRWVIRASIGVCILCLLFGAFNVGTISAVSLDIRLGFFAASSYNVITFAFTLYISHFIMILTKIRMRFCMINKCFKSNFATNDLHKLVSSSSPGSRQIIETLTKLHDCLNDSVGMANGYFALPMLITLSCVFANIVVTVFTVYKMLVKDHTYEDFWSGIVYGIDCGFYVFFLVVVVAISSDLTYQGKYTAVLVHKAISRNEDASIAEKLKSWSLQLLHRQPIVTCGLFSYDWTLFYSVTIALALRDSCF
ncbi:hypothetical protein DMENIID0001_042920 [Sergentomyia squamirostris]